MHAKVPADFYHSVCERRELAMLHSVSTSDLKKFTPRVMVEFADQPVIPIAAVVPVLASAQGWTAADALFFLFSSVTRLRNLRVRLLSHAGMSVNLLRVIFMRFVFLRML